MLLLTVLALLAFTPQAHGQSIEPLTEGELLDIPAGDQPIKFSHKVHVTDNAVPCEYCHSGVSKSAVANIPGTSVCMGCHQYVGTTLSEVQKVAKHWEDGTVIEWVKIHDVPDFVSFSHERHINASNANFPDGVPCANCHGDIGSMHVVTMQDDDFGTMGWCLDCHLQQPGALELKRSLPLPDDVKHSEVVNLSDCLVCHK